MIVLGLTGTLGAGKSTVARCFEAWSARRVDADELARRAVAPGSRGLRRIRKHWGSDVLDDQGRLDRGAMRERVFADDEERRRLEAIVHPEVRRLLDQEVREAERAGAEVVVAEVPLLLEGGLEDAFDVVVVVDADRDVRRRRVLAERDLDRETFRAIEEAQWSGARKRAAADLVITNDGTREQLEAAARSVWEEIRARAGRA